MPLDAIAPANNDSGNKGGNGPSYNEDVDILNEGEDLEDVDVDNEDSEEDVDSEDVGDKKAKKEKKEEESKEEDEEEEDSEEDTEDNSEEEDDEEDIKGPFHRPTVKEIKAAFPDIFKKFPELKDSYFRELEFSKIFPTIDEAKEAFADNEAYNILSEAALGGDSEPLIDSIKKTDAKALELFAVSFLPNIFKKDQDVYYTVITPLFENMLRQAYKDGDENLKNSANNIAQYLFGKDGEASVEGKKTIGKTIEITNEQKKINETRDQKVSTDFRNMYTAVEVEIDKNLTSLISKQIDPDKSMTKFLRANLAAETIKRIKKQLESDTSHGSVMGARWKRAKLNGYTEDDKSKIISTFLARAKSLVPVTSEKVRLAAMSKNVRKPEIHKKEVNGGRGSSSKVPEKVDYRKISDMDILNN